MTGRTGLMLALALATAALPAARAEELTLNDLPRVLEQINTICRESDGYFGKSQVCERRNVWVAVEPGGKLTLFSRRSAGGESVYASGGTVSELLRDYAAKLGRQRADDAVVLERLAPFLPTQ